MRKRGRIFPIFSLLLASSILLFVFSQKGILQGVSGFAERLVSPLKKAFYQSFVGLEKDNSSQIARLRDENRKLIAELVRTKELERENQALQDQFATASPAPEKLLPAGVIGMIGFLPGVTNPDEIVIDKGKSDGVGTGSVVVYKNNVVGRIITASAHFSIVLLPTSKNFYLTAQTAKTSALGILQGQGENTMVLANVVLSDTIEKDDIVITRDDIDKNGGGFPPQLVLGKIVSVSKKASNLFQAAKIESLVDYSKLNTVFVITGK